MIELSAEQLERAQKLLGHIPGAVPKAIANAINRAAEGGRTDAVKKTREVYTISPSRIRETMEIRKAQTSNLSAAVISRGQPRALSYFKIKPSKPTKRRPKDGVYAQVKYGAGGIIAKSFVAKMANGHIGVFNRSAVKYMKDQGPRPKKRGAGNTKGRFAIDQHYGPSVPQMLGNQSVIKFVEEGAKRRLDERLDHEINRILRGYGK
ncbi:hypothetical protein SCACP_21390 [Sporomusa carbonis]|uniref:phage tail protein n=1 Tax=Sporomusa carbonis TaxID=3076075 RepID=UPI003A61A739